MSLNMCIFSGRITADPEMSYSAGGLAVTKLTLAIDTWLPKSRSRGAMFMNCVCFDKVAEKTSRYIGKGDFIEVCGRLDENNYTDRNGTLVKSFNLVCDKVEFTPAKGKDRQSLPRTEEDIPSTPNMPPYYQQQSGNVTVTEEPVQHQQQEETYY